MSKSGELNILKYGYSVDAPRNFYHRSGDSEGSAGSILDYYAQEESAEEVYFKEQDEDAREVFARAFKLYLKKTLTRKERKFLSGILSGKKKPAELGREMGVKWFEYMQEIQRKAFNNAEVFGRVVQLSGWSRAQEFAETVFKRFEQLHAGADLNELLPQNKKIDQFRIRKAEIMRRWRAVNNEHFREYQKEYMAQWRSDHREEMRERARAYYAAHLEEMRERSRRKRENPEYLEKERDQHRRYYAEHVEERRIKNKEYFAERREEINAKHRAYYEKNKERILAGRNTPEKREKHLEYMKEYNKTHRAEEREYRRARYKQVKERKQEMARKWREANLEHVRERQREAKRRYDARKKAEKEAAKALAALLVLSQTQEPSEAEALPVME